MMKVNHGELWAGVKKAARGAREAKIEPQHTEFPATLERARHLMVSAYVHFKMRAQVGPLRDRIIEGILIALVNDDEADGVRPEELVTRMSSLLALSRLETQLLVENALKRLVGDGLCRETDKGIACETKDRGLEDDVQVLVEGAVNRLGVREGIEIGEGGRELIRAVLDDVILMRGWDLGAQFSGANVHLGAALWSATEQAVRRAYKGKPDHKAGRQTAAIYDLLSRPTDEEAQILADLGRLSFGMDVVLQHGHSALLHTETLPEKVYMDSNFLMPAIVNGHPSRPAYIEAIGRWQDAARASGVSHSLLVLEEFLDEIIYHRAGGINLVEELNLEEPDNLRKHIQFFGAEGTNVFVGSYGSWVGRVARNHPTFDEFLKENAPYETMNQLKEYLRSKGFSVVSATREADADEERAYQLAFNALESAYEKDRRTKKKEEILMRHEARQLARLHLELLSGERSVFVSSDNRLRQAAKGPVLGYAGGAIISSLAFIQLVDLLVGMQPEPASLARLMWGVRFVEDRTAAEQNLRAYLTDRAVQHYDAGALLSLPDILTKVVGEAQAEAQREGIKLSGEVDQATVTKFLDRFENRFFKDFNEALQAERRRSERGPD